MSVTGGHNLRRITQRALNAVGVRDIEVGFFATAKYEDGTPVAAVAAWNEFGTQRGDEVHVPERPFFRQAIDQAEGKVFDHLVDHVDGETLVVTERLGDDLAEIVVGEIQQRIADLREPPNAPSTKAAKGSSNPLIDDGTLRTSVTYRVER